MGFLFLTVKASKQIKLVHHNFSSHIPPTLSCNSLKSSNEKISIVQKKVNVNSEAKLYQKVALILFFFFCCGFLATF